MTTNHTTETKLCTNDIIKKKKQDRYFFIFNIYSVVFVLPKRRKKIKQFNFFLQKKVYLKMSAANNVRLI